VRRRFDVGDQEQLQKAGVSSAVSQELVSQNRASQVRALDASLAVLPLVAVIALFFTV